MEESIALRPLKNLIQWPTQKIEEYRNKLEEHKNNLQKEEVILENKNAIIEKVKNYLGQIDTILNKRTDGSKRS